MDETLVGWMGLAVLVAGAVLLAAIAIAEIRSDSND